MAAKHRYQLLLKSVNRPFIHLQFVFMCVCMRVSTCAVCFPARTSLCVLHHTRGPNWASSWVLMCMLCNGVPAHVCVLAAALLSLVENSCTSLSHRVYFYECVCVCGSVVIISCTGLMDNHMIMKYESSDDAHGISHPHLSHALSQGVCVYMVWPCIFHLPTFRNPYATGVWKRTGLWERTCVIECTC